jgi:hypothetical protein
MHEIQWNNQYKLGATRVHWELGNLNWYYELHRWIRHQASIPHNFVTLFAVREIRRFFLYLLFIYLCMTGSVSVGCYRLCISGMSEIHEMKSSIILDLVSKIVVHFYTDVTS